MLKIKQEWDRQTFVLTTGKGRRMKQEAIILTNQSTERMIKLAVQKGYPVERISGDEKELEGLKRLVSAAGQRSAKMQRRQKVNFTHTPSRVKRVAKVQKTDLKYELFTAGFSRDEILKILSAKTEADLSGIDLKQLNKVVKQKGKFSIQKALDFINDEANKG